MINSALKRLRNDLIDFTYQVDLLKNSLIETNKLKNNNEINRGFNSKYNLLKLKEIKANLIRINDVN